MESYDRTTLNHSTICVMVESSSKHSVEVVVPVYHDVVMKVDVVDTDITRSLDHEIFIIIIIGPQKDTLYSEVVSKLKQ